MVSWIVIIILVVVILVAIKLNHLKHRILIISLMLIILFLYSTVNIITADKEISLTNIKDIFSIVKVYFGWMANGFNNMKEITGHTIKQDWTNTNASFFNK